MTTEKEYIDLMIDLTCDTLLSVKYNNTGKDVWVHYWIPCTRRKDKTAVLFGQLYSYFANKDGFCMALGYLGFETIEGRRAGQTQYFGFTRNQPPHWAKKSLSRPIILEQKNCWV
jgi:hypothetical protein